MKIGTTVELEQFRAEIRAFVRAHAPGLKQHTGVRAPEPELVPNIRRWTAALFEAGYLGADWPEKYGGSADVEPEKALIVAEEITRARTWAPIGAYQLGAAAILNFGTDAQKNHYLPRIRSGQDIWCQLFSEPGAGSDLASLRTRACLDGDHYVLTGQKVWTTNGQYADVGYLLARTDADAPKHRGITAFALDMTLPGISVRPLREITGTFDFNEVFLDEVRVPVDAVIGKVNDGWRVANLSLAHERTAVAAFSVELIEDLSRLVELAGEQLGEPAVRRDVGRIATHTRVIDLMSTSAQAAMAAGTAEDFEAPMLKIFFSQTNLALVELGMSLQRSNAVAVEGDVDVISDGWWQDAFLYARAWTIAGGANEVLKNVVAERGLGLPREPA